MGPDAEAAIETDNLPTECVPPLVLRIPVRTCRVCFGPHDAEIHAATLSVHSWFRYQVTRYLDPDGPFLSDATGAA